jgi:N-acetylmuramoyl-L-alanine amidase
MMARLRCMETWISAFESHNAMRWPLCLLILVFGATSLQAETRIDQMRLWRSPDSTRLVFDLSGAVDHTLFELENPHRIVLDMNKVAVAANTDQLDLSGTPLRQIRTGKRPDGGLRVVFDLQSNVKTRSFSLEPTEGYGNRLVVDFFDDDTSTVRTIDDFTESNRDVLIAIDAGHGGEDPGALGPGKVQEKDVVLGIANALKRQIDSMPGYSAVMVRTGDYYVSLEDRAQRGRSERADLFISIHADSFVQPSAHGASVYALSQRGATSEMASYLAQRENRADLIGGVGELSLRDKDATLAGVLLDLSMTATLDSSLRAGDDVIRELGQVTRMHKRQVEQASFVVLKSPDMPSLLIETGFISNPEEARRLSDSTFQSSLAVSIFRGVQSYFAKYPPEGSMIAQNISLLPKTYIIQRGDTLSEIAERFGVSMALLQRQNNLSDSSIRVGQTINIPTS